MVRKLLLLIVVLALISGSFSCGLVEKVKPSISGTYVCTQGSTKGDEFFSFEKGCFFEFKKDGDLYIGFGEGEPGTIGTWELDGDEILVTTEFFGATIAWKGKLKGDTIVLEDGSIWVKEKEEAATPTTSTLSPEKATTPTSPTAALTLPPGTTSVGDFTVALSSVEREESVTTLQCAITKASDTGSETGTTTVILTDDHGSKYEGTLNIIPEGSPNGFLSLLPQDFTYVAGVTITMPRAAPITRLKLGEAEEVAFRDVQSVEPSFDQDFNAFSITPGTSSPLGKYLTFTLGSPVAGVVGWSLPVTVTNSEYNPLSVEVKLGLQLVDGSVSWAEAGQKIVEVPGSGQVTLEPQIMTISECLSGFPLTSLLISFADESTGQQSLRLMSLTLDQFPSLPERIAFHWDADVSIYVPTGIYVMKTDGSNVTKLADYSRHPAWSPDGKKIAFKQHGTIQVMNGDGSEIATLIRGSAPAWSPDGGRIAFITINNIGMETGNVCVVNTNGSGMTTLYHGDNWGTYAANPTWSPDGTKIAFEIGVAATSEMHLMNSDGSGKAPLVRNGRSPAWSPDGTKIAFVYGSWANDRDIAVMNVDGTGLTTLADGCFNSPAWSPDGTKIAFSSSYPPTIFIMNADGSGKTTIAEGHYPSWAPALKLTEQGLVPLGMTKPAEGATAAQVPQATAEVANLDRSELTELRGVVEEVLTQAELIANEDEKRLLAQAEMVLATIQTESILRDLVAEKTEEERLILDLLEGIFAVGAEYFYKIPSLIAGAIAKGAEELGNQIAEWQVLGQLSFARVTQPDSGIMEVVYHKELGEVWVDFDIHDPAGRVSMYIPVEPDLVSSEGGGNILLSQGVGPVMENVRIAYRLGGTTVSTALDPSDLVKAFYEAFSNEKYSEVTSYYGPEGQAMILATREGYKQMYPEKSEATIWIDAITSAIGEAFYLEWEEDRWITLLDMERIEINNEKISEDGKRAEVEYTIYITHGIQFSETRHLYKIEGIWRIGRRK